jgi:hypothetical protein
MSLEEANYIVRFSIEYSPSGWYFVVDTRQPYGNIIGYNKFETPNEALEELKQFLRYFTKSVLKNGDTIRAYVEKHKPKKDAD